MDKTKLRQTYNAIRQDMTKADVQAISRSIANHVSAHITYSPQRILSYKPITKYNEIDPTFIERLFPGATITNAPLDPQKQFKQSVFDLILVPMIAGDRKCHRLGFGGGWYDRFLSSQPDAIKIGLCYEACIVDELPHEAHDIPLDAIVTEIKVITRTVE